MISLIKNEIIKIFKKKTIYVMLCVTLGFIMLINAVYKYTDSKIAYGEYYSDSYIETVKENIKELDPENPEEVMAYVDCKTEIDNYNLLEKYDKNSWQYKIISDYGRNYIANINYYTYQNKNSEELAKAKAEYDEFMERINSGNWKKFAEEELENLKKSIAYGTNDNMSNIEIESLQMRLDYNIEYGNNYKNIALSRYSSSKMQVLEYENNSNIKTYNEKKSYQEAKENMEKSKYVIENDKDIFDSGDLRGRLINMFSEYELLIIITVVAIAGAIVSEEFSKGTIKLLLVKPYSRRKILLSKFIVVALTIIFIMIVIGIMQFIVGGILFGFDSLNIPVVEYNHKTGSLVEMSILQNILLTGLAKLPIYILIGTLAFAISTLLTNTAVAITISMLGYMGSQIINQFAYYYDISWLKYFVTPNWDLTQFLYGRLPNMQGINIAFSIAICVIYFLIMIIATFIGFQKRNIKNV